MTLQQQLQESLFAGFGGIWVSSYEHVDAFSSLTRICKAQNWPVITWDPELGLVTAEGPVDKPGTPPNPIAALHYLNKQTPAKNQRIILVMQNVTGMLSSYDGKVGSPTMLQVLQRTIEEGSTSGRHVIIFTYDHIAIPAELQKMVYVIDHNLPDADEMWGLITSVNSKEDDENDTAAADSDAKLPERDSPEARKLLDASAGFGRLEVLGAVALSRTRHKGQIRPEVLWDMKRKMLQKTGLLEMLSRQQLAENDIRTGFSSIGGLNALKEFCLQMFNSPTRSKTVRPLGLTLVGPPGCGKSLFAASLGDEVGWPTVRLDIGRLMGGLVGSTEANTRMALKTIDAMAPAVVMIDEAEKAFSGTTGGANDSGVGARILGSILTWMNDHLSDTFVIFTCNAIELLPPELFRSERIDGIFFLDLPGDEQKNEVWNLYIKQYTAVGLTADQVKVRPDDKNWTPAEIKACCRQACLCGLTLVDAARRIVPIFKTSHERIGELRKWATNRCLSAEYRGLYDENGEQKMLTVGEIAARPRRRVTRAAS